MASTINAITTGAGGIVTTGDSTGNISLQSNGATVLAVTSTGLAVTGTLTATGTTFGNSTLKYVTDTTDISVTALAPTHTTVGTTFSVSIPTTGFIRLASFAGKIINNTATTYAGPTFGIRIGSTNYWLALSNLTGVDTYFPLGLSATTTLSDYVIMYGSPNGYAGAASYAFPQILDIAALSVPTGTQTVQLIVAKNTQNVAYNSNFTLKGTTNTTRVGLEFVST